MGDGLSSSSSGSLEKAITMTPSVPFQTIE
jgi:hypothetical protein